MEKDPVRVELVNQRKTWEERVTPYLAIFISILALGVAVDQGIKAREHDRLTALPSIGFELRAADAEKTAGLYITNHGFGPGRLNRFRVYLDGYEVHREPDADIWQVITNKNSSLFKDVQKDPPTWYWPDDGNVMRNGAEEIGLYVTDTSNITDMNAFRRLIGDRIGLSVHVCSVYGDCEFVCSNLSNCPEEQHDSFQNIILRKLGLKR
jgi:hypothetical protein